MTKEALIEELKQGGDDNEADHYRAERLLLAYIDDPDISEAFDKARIDQNWWYS